MATFQYASEADKRHDVDILNRALFFEHRGVWAYRAAADRVSSSAVGKAVLELAAQNRSDHEKHEDLLVDAIVALGGAPLKVQNEYDLSSLIKRGQGNLDSDVNIAKLALALEVGAAAGYISDTMQLKAPSLIELEGGIACVEAIHAARIRAAFNNLGVNVPVVANPIMTAGTRGDWVLKVEAAAAAAHA